VSNRAMQFLIENSSTLLESAFAPSICLVFISTFPSFRPHLHLTCASWVRSQCLLLVQQPLLGEPHDQ
jgi:hypothetical protein